MLRSSTYPPPTKLLQLQSKIGIPSHIYGTKILSVTINNFSNISTRFFQTKINTEPTNKSTRSFSSIRGIGHPTLPLRAHYVWIDEKKWMEAEEEEGAEGVDEEGEETEDKEETEVDDEDPKKLLEDSLNHMQKRLRQENQPITVSQPGKMRHVKKSRLIFQQRVLFHLNSWRKSSRELKPYLMRDLLIMKDIKKRAKS